MDMPADTTPPVITPETVNDPTTGPGEFQKSLLTNNYGNTCTSDDNNPAYVGICVIFSGFIDTRIFGFQEVIFTANDDPAGNSPLNVAVNTTVVDTLAPILTVVAPNPVEIEVGQTYVDTLGADVTDNDEAVDGTNIPGAIPPELVGILENSDLGSHTVTYDLTDPSGNSALQVIRTVNVISVGGSDTVEITRVTVSDSNQLRVTATSTDQSSVLSVYDSNDDCTLEMSDIFIENMQKKRKNYSLRFSSFFPDNTHITVFSSNGGCDTFPIP